MKKIKLKPKVEKIQWTDATGYSRDDTERIQTSWEWRGKHLRIFITKGHIHYPGYWIMHCFELGIKEEVLSKDISTPVETIQAVAVGVVISKLAQSMTDIINNYPV